MKLPKLFFPRVHASPLNPQSGPLNYGPIFRREKTGRTAHFQLEPDGVRLIAPDRTGLRFRFSRLVLNGLKETTFE